MFPPEIPGAATGSLTRLSRRPHKSVPQHLLYSFGQTITLEKIFRNYARTFLVDPRQWEHRPRRSGGMIPICGFLKWAPANVIRVRCSLNAPASVDGLLVW